MEKLTFVALSVASSVTTLLAQKGAVQPLAHMGWEIRAGNAVVFCVRYLHKMAEAADAYIEALRLKPDYAEAYNNLANILLVQGHRSEAIRHNREALRLDPRHEKARRQLLTLVALPSK